jgi:hypothetical protein
MTCGGCSGAIERVLKKNIEARELLPVQGLARVRGTKEV